MTRLHIPVPLRWADLDAYGHVNNVAMLRLLEEARIAAFWRPAEAPDPRFPTAILDAGPHAGTHTFVARTEIEYLAPLDYRRDGVVVELWVGRLGGASLDVCYELTDGRPAGDPARQVYGQAETTVVLVDAQTGRPRRCTTTEREVWGAYAEAPVLMRRRRDG